MLTAQAGRVGVFVATVAVLLTACTAAAPDQEPPHATASSAVSRPAVVVLDPGHSGGTAGRAAELNRQVPNGRGGTKPCNNTGASTDAGYPEHTFNWDVAQRTKSLLEGRGVMVVLTRLDDTGLGPCVNDRGTAGQRANADAVVSIHADGAPAAGRGFHVSYSDPPLNDVQRGPAAQLAGDLRDALRAARFPTSTYLGRDGLAPRADLAGLNFAERPAAFVECANLRNPAEAAVVASAEGRQRYALAIAEGLLAFLARR